MKWRYDKENLARRLRRAAKPEAIKKRKSTEVTKVYKERERRAAESPASRQARLASDKAARGLCSPLSTLHHHQPTCWKYKTDRMGYPCPVTKTRLVELQLPEDDPCEEAADEDRGGVSGRGFGGGGIWV